MTGVTLQGLACERGGRLLFEHVSLTLGPGGAACVRGPNGAGKSSLLRVIAGLLAPAAGEVRAEGGIALAAEQPALDPQAPLARALGFWAALDGADGAAVLAGLGDMGIAHLAEVPVRLLSTGQRKRGVLARTIAGARPIWLLDEPTNGLDDVAIGLLEVAIATHRARGGIVIVATHQPIALPDAVDLAL